MNGAVSELGLFGSPHWQNLGLNAAQASKEAAENLRRLQNRKILNSINGPGLGSQSNRDGSDNLECQFFDPFSDPETREKRVEEYPPNHLPYSCPRYDEIKQWLIANRDPLHLAIDSMGILAEPAFYRYIRDRSAYLKERNLGVALNVTPHEFRGFLATAQARRELFV